MNDRLQYGEGSVLVVAHPDDEVLWFGSVLQVVERVIVCLLGSRRRPELGAARRASLAAHPLAHLTCLELDQSDSFGGADWRHPEFTSYGLGLPFRPEAETAYRENYTLIRERLGPLLAGCRQVFTHSPWGEYGHEEHVQVHRLVAGLQAEHGYALWYPNTCGRRTRHLARRQQVPAEAEIMVRRGDLRLVAQLKNHYLNHGCWTWDPEWAGFAHEVFIGRGGGGPAPAGRGGNHAPLNVVPDTAEAVRPRILRRVAKRLSRPVRLAGER